MALARRWQRWLLWLLALGLLGWVWGQVPWVAVGAALQQIAPAGLAAIVALDLLIVLSMSGRWWVLLLGWGERLPYLRLCGYRLAAIGVSYFTPGPQFGGEPLQVWALTRFHGLAPSKAIAAVTVDKLLELVANFTLLLWGSLVVLQTAVFPAESTRWAIVLALLMWSLPLSLVILLARGAAPLSKLLNGVVALLPWLQRQPRTAAIGQTVAESEAQVRLLWQQSPRAFYLALLVTLLNWLLWLAEFWLMYALLGLRLGLSELLVLLTAARIAFLLPLPSGLGSLEASQMMAMAAIGETAVVGLTATLLIRLRDTLLAGFGLWLSGRLLQNKEQVGV